MSILLREHTCLSCGIGKVNIIEDKYSCPTCGTTYAPADIVKCDICGEECLRAPDLAVAICPRCRKEKEAD